MNTPNTPDFAAENAELRARLEEAEETLRAIRAGEVDALVMAGEVYTLKGAETPYRLLIESMNEGAATLAPDGTILYCNRRFADMVATPAEQIIGSHLGRWVAPAYQPIVRALVTTAEHAGARAELAFSVPPGPDLPVMLSLRPILLDSHTIGVVAADLTERKRAEEELRRANASLEERVAARTEELRHQREWLSVTLGSIGDALIATDAAGRVNFLNPVAEALTGWSRQEALGQPAQSLFRIVDETTRVPGEDIVGRVLREGAVIKLANNICLITRDGREIPIEDSAAPIEDKEGRVAGAVLVFHDVTAKRRAQRALRESEQRLNHAQQIANLGSWEWDIQTGALWWSEQVYRQMGQEPGQFTPTHAAFMQRIHPEDRAALETDLQRTLAGTAPYDGEFRIVRPDGTVRELRSRGEVLSGPDGRPRSMMGVCLDITERKQAEAELHRSREEYCHLVERSGSVILRADRDMRITFMNQFGLQFFGYRAEELIGQRALGTIIPSVDAAGQDIAAMAEDLMRHPDQYTTNVHQNQCKDGRLVWMSWANQAIYDGHGQLIEMLAIGNDLTKLKEAEAALVESEARAKVTEAVQVERQRLQEVLNMLPAYVILLSPDYRVPFANRFFEERFGQSKGKRCYEYLFNRSEPCEVCETFKVLKTRTPLRWEWTGPDGRNYDIHDFPFTDLDGSPLIMEVGMDITERKQAEAALAKHRDHLEELVKERTEALCSSETRYRALFENMTEGFALHEIITDERGEPCDYRFLEVNPAFERLTGLPPGGLVGKRVREVMPATEASWIRNYGKVALTGEPMHFEDFSSTLNRWYEVFAYQPALSQFAVVFADITTRKQAEREIFNANQRLEALMRAVPVGVSFSDDATCQHVTGNPAVLAQFEVAPADNLSASAPDDVAPGRQVRFYHEGRPITDAELPLQRAVAENKVIPPMELEVQLPNGRCWFAEASGAPVHGPLGEVIGGLAVTVDITARKQAEEALRKSEALALSEKEFHLLAEAMPQIVWATRADGWNTYFNQRWVDYTGLTLEESYGRGWNKPFHPDDRQRAWDAWQNAVTNRATYDLECRLRRADGTYRWWLIRGVPVLDEQGSVLKWFGTCTDFNDLREAQEALREAGEERLRLVLEATSMGTFEVDLRTGEGHWNTVEFDLLGLKPGEAPSVPATFFRYLHPDDAARVQAQWAEATQTGILNTEFRIVRADGQVRWLAALGRFAYAGKPDASAPEGKPEPERFLGVNFDITERKQMEEEVRRRAEELRATNEELDRFNQAMVGRELRMIELKQEINALCTQLGQPPRYGTVQGEAAPPAQ